MTSNPDRGATLAQPSDPTPHAEVNVALEELLVGARAALGNRLCGMYLYGSLALGDFAPHRSDIDVLFVTDADLPDERVAALRAMHARFAAGDSPWATEVEASYIPRDALRRYDPAHALHPHVDRGSGSLTVEQHEIDWVIQRYVLRAYGVTLAGPPLQTLIDPIEQDELRLAVVTSVRRWWAPMGHDPARLRGRGYQAYAVLTMCRILYTLDTGAVVSKPAAARWALGTLDAQWAPLIKRALAWRKERQKTLGTDVEDTMRLIRYVTERCRQCGDGKWWNGMESSDMISLREVTRENWRATLRLAVHPEQRRFVAGDDAPIAAIALAKAYVRAGGVIWAPYAIVASEGEAEEMVGFVALAYEPESADEYWVFHFFIDRRYQGRGYGAAALARLIELVRREHPHTRRLQLVVHPENQPARRLYTRAGFRATGTERWGEPVYQLTLRGEEEDGG